MKKRRHVIEVSTMDSMKSGMTIVRRTISYLRRKMVNFFLDFYFSIVERNTFFFNGKKLNYFLHTYNKAYENERTIEIPIVIDFLSGAAHNARILEVGNVLKNYGYKRAHDVLDKYDVSMGVINEDVISFNPKMKYDYVVSISTFEHVGWDESPREPHKIIDALKNVVRNCLNPKGQMLVTIPLGYNFAFDKYLRNGELNEIFDKNFF